MITDPNLSPSDKVLIPHSLTSPPNNVATLRVSKSFTIFYFFPELGSGRAASIVGQTSCTRMKLQSLSEEESNECALSPLSLEIPHCLIVNCIFKIIRIKKGRKEVDRIICYSLKKKKLSLFSTEALKELTFPWIFPVFCAILYPEGRVPRYYIHLYKG